jgi:lysophospholipase L1-like esterase
MNFHCGIAAMRFRIRESPIMKNTLCILSVMAISLGCVCASSAAKADAGLSSKQGKGKIFPPNSTFLHVAGHDAYLALPDGVKPGQKTPWLWYMPSDYKLPGKLEQWMMKTCLSNGIAVAGIDLQGDFGTPAGREIQTAFYKELTENHGVTDKVCLLARSYGGTQMYNWAVEHPKSIACLAGIYPVCNLESYPGLKSAAGKYRMPQEQLVKELKQHNPIDRLAPLAKAKVPIYHNTGDIDTLVPPKDNSFLVEKRYKALGGDITVTIFEGQGHNYWTGFFEDEAMAEFIIKHAKKAARLPKVLIIGDSISGGYSKSLIKALDGKAEIVKLGAVATYRINKEAFWHSRGTAKALDFGSAKACVADLERFERHLLETQYDVIHFNFGLNDIFRGRNGAWHNPVDQYAKDLATIVTLLKKNGAQIIWSNITPIPAHAPHNPEGDELIYNAAAAKVMKANNIPINDLHSVVKSWDGYEKFMQGNDVHCGGAYGKLAAQIAEAITAQLDTPAR